MGFGGLFYFLGFFEVFFFGFCFVSGEFFWKMSYSCSALI